MKVLLLTLMLLLCSAQVLTLRCYTCGDENDDICKEVTDCPESSYFCKTFESDTQFSRTCEEFCVEDHLTTCCTSDLCP
ncbi:lymphocyte antigen 6D [Anarrhichthys ocellatus]|uniref:lymphocyte antigen 6D n=1 Tax=Anarrhichthys ocellatus TaxID=433405 RepID=UPI0012EE728E|nr:lymphocyte antigen 6D-like [Anarrhichthys ocellatus]